MKKNVFKICSCENPIAHGCIYFTNGQRTHSIFSLNYARSMLELAKEQGMVTPEEADALIQEIAAAGISEDGPDKEVLEALQKKDEELEKLFAEALKKIKIPMARIIVIPFADLNAPE